MLYILKPSDSSDKEIKIPQKSRVRENIEGDSAGFADTHFFCAGI
jgi:hypothetical protein